MTKAERVLRFIKENPTGRTFTQIQEFVVTMNGLDWNERVTHTWEDFRGNHRIQRTETRRKWRGYWCDYLLSSWTGPGLLKTFCARTNAGRYIVIKPIKPPFKPKRTR
jgi:hypothetical protein